MEMEMQSIVKYIVIVKAQLVLTLSEAAASATESACRTLWHNKAIRYSKHSLNMLPRPLSLFHSVRLALSLDISVRWQLINSIAFSWKLPAVFGLGQICISLHRIGGRTGEAALRRGRQRPS